MFHTRAGTILPWDAVRYKRRDLEALEICTVQEAYVYNK